MVLVPTVTQSDVEEIADDVRECDQRPMVYYARLSTDRKGLYRVTVVAENSRHRCGRTSTRGSS
jgi:hypothetical protein